MIPQFLIWSGLGQYDTYQPLWLPALFGSGFFVFLMRQFMLGIPAELEDAARIAFYELVMWLEADYGIERLTAYQLCSQVASVRLANMVDILYSVVAKFPKRYLPRA